MTKTYNFDQIIDRTGTHTVKYDDLEKTFGTKEVIPLWVADMDLPAPDEVVEALTQRANHHIYGYPIQNSKALHTPFINWVERRHQWSIESHWVTYIPGIVPAIAMAINIFSNPGDKIIVQPPVYPPFLSIPRHNGRQLVFNNLIQTEEGFKMDLEKLERQIDRRTRMLILCNPHNPGGNVWQKEELLRLSEICDKHGILVISDEIHADLTWSGYKHTPYATISEAAANHSLTFMAPSKTFNIAGLNCSFAIIPNKNLFNKFNVFLDNLHINQINIFAMEAAIAAYNHGEEWLKQVITYLEGNADFILSFLEKNHPSIKTFRPKSSFLMWLNFEALKYSPSKLHHFIIHKAHLGLNKGSTFGPGGENHQRLNIGCPRPVLKKAMDQLSQALKEIGF